MSCSRAQEFLARNKVKASTTVDAKKTKMGPAKALELARQSSEIYASKGKKVVHIDMRKENPDDAELISLMIGPSGNLRAPTMQVGKTLVVGFSEDSFSKVLK